MDVVSLSERPRATLAVPLRWYRAVGFRLAIGVLALVLALPAMEAGARLREVPNVDAVVTDGERFAVFEREGRRVVLDTRTRRERVIDSDCAVQGSRSGRALLKCADADSLVDLRSGRRFELPASVSTGARSVPVRWYRLGSRWAQGTGRCGRPWCSVYFDVVRGGSRLGPGTVVDLDAADLRRRYACAAQRRLDRRLARMPWAPFERFDDGLLLVPRTGYWRRAPGLYVRGCPHRRVLSHADVTEPRLGGGLVSWNTGHDEDVLTSGNASDRGSLWLAGARTGARTRWPLPRTPYTDCEGNRGGASVGRQAHTRYMVFWTATRRTSGFLCDQSHGARVFFARVPSSLRR